MIRRGFYRVPVRPISCPECGQDAPLTGCGETLVGYSSPEGHDHNDNCLTMEYTCPEKHVVRKHPVRRCYNSTCDWTGKTTCFCTGNKDLDWLPPAKVELQGPLDIPRPLVEGGCKAWTGMFGQCKFMDDGHEFHMGVGGGGGWSTQTISIRTTPKLVTGGWKYKPLSKQDAKKYVVKFDPKS